MRKLNAAQIEVLTRAAQTDAGSIDPADLHKTNAAALIRRGFLISVPQAEGGSQLVITETGRAEIGGPVAQPTRPTKFYGPAKAPAAKTKIEILIDLLRQPDGATVDAMIAATGWQAHSVRGAMSGTLRKDRGLNVHSEQTGSGRIYYIDPPAPGELTPREHFLAWFSEFRAIVNLVNRGRAN